MIKKLDLLILKSFIGPFIITFFIAIFVLTMQILWKYIDDLVGKGLDFITIGKFVWYASASLLILAMPIAIIISTIMTFGNLGESFELVAIKSAGISLLRFMRPLIIFTAFLCGITFFFANNVVPYTQLKFVTLYNDIFFQKPAFELKPGVFFTTIPSYAIRIGNKNEDGSAIKDVLIYEQGNYLQDNSIAATEGRMSISPNKDFLEFNLYNGTRYQERGNQGDSSTEYYRLHFKEYKKLFDLSVFARQSTNDSVFRNNQKMMSARQLNNNIDSLQVIADSVNNNNFKTVANYFKYNMEADTILSKKTIVNNGNYKIPAELEVFVKSNANNTLNEIKNNYTFIFTDNSTRRSAIRLGKIEWHRKFAFSLACMVLFFIGAPLGSIIRKGGIGLPLVVAIGFFLVFHLLNVFGEKFVKEDLASPFAGMWFAVMVLTPIGVFLTYKAMHDSTLFNKDFFKRQLKVLLKNKELAEKTV